MATVRENPGATSRPIWTVAIPPDAISSYMSSARLRGTAARPVSGEMVVENSSSLGYIADFAAGLAKACPKPGVGTRHAG